MGNLDLPPDVIGHMCALGGTDEPLEMCPSCQRAVVYGVLLWGSASIGALDEAGKALAKGDVMELAAQVAKGRELVTAIVRTLVEVAKTDFASMCNLVEMMSDEEYTLALQAFIHQRTEHYTDPQTGRIIFEPHDEAGEDEDGDDLATTGS